MLNIHSVFDERESGDHSQSSTTKEMIPPITTAELLDGSNRLPLSMAEAVSEAADFIRSAISEEKKRNASPDARTLDIRMMEAREARDLSGAAAAEIDDLTVEWSRKSLKGLTGPELRWVRARIQDKFLGFDALEPLMRDPRVTEILVLAPAPHEVAAPDGDGGTRKLLDGGTRVEIGGQLIPAPGVVFGSDDEVLDLAAVILPRNSPTVSEPIQSGVLDNMTRVEVRHRIIGEGHTFIALRRHPLSAWTLKMLVDNGTVSQELACDLATWKRDRYNLIVSGGTSSGKTTLLNGLLGFVDPAHHLIIIEDTPELNPPPFVFASRATTRPSRGDMRDVTQNDLMRSSLRSRPEILAIGEARGGELVEVLKAQRTGHHGSFSTIHADSAADSIVRMKDMLGETSEGATGSLDHRIASAIDIIIYQRRLDDGRRRVTEVIEIQKPDRDSTREVSEVAFKRLYAYDPETDSQIKVGEVSDSLKGIRGVSLNSPPVTWAEIEQVHDLSRVR